ncbi:hypothetical protein TsFJ059_008293 [Trichoderma semiorbis]|uniref:Protein ZIP4 homolog n=1 Tax=Trichoderma semiorbis TaxID=1491008 RepID=A0A9P8HKN8_9HYPO|nr:hypothetical protein TsFJ059_008293 [Trichoderma semiorbis]
MAPDDLASAGRIRKARSFVEFAATLQSKLSDSLDGRQIDLLLADTGHHVQLIHNAVPLGSTGPLPPKLAKDVERHGRDLWNLCVRLKRERNTSDSIEKAKLLLNARSLAFSMLELGRSAGRAKEDTGVEVAYLMSLSLTLGKHCVEDSDLDSARSALQKTAELMERLKAAPLDASDPREQSERTKLDAEYLAMRTALHIGFDLASKGDHSMAVKWLKRAYDIINHQALDQLSISLIDWDHELGSESIRHLSRLSDSPQGRDVLYACIREAQQAGDKLCTLTALQAIIESWTTDQATPSNLTSILRCSIRLIHLIEEKAAEQANQHPKDDVGNIVFTVPELHWFRKNAYNMGVAKCDTWELFHIIRIFKTCLAFSVCYPKDLPSSEAAEIAMMALRCHFVIAAALASLARKEDRVEEQLQYYLQVRHHMDEFYAILETNTDEIMDESTAADLNAKLSTLFVFDFEAATVLRDWDGLNGIVRKAKACRDEVMYKAMGDCVLRSKAPGKALFSTMRLIINEIFELEEFDYEKLAKYIRCMFQAILGLDDTAALQLVDQAIQIAREGKEAGNQLPSAELEWLVATSFNHAIDYYARGEEEPCHRWALKAMHLAEYIDDGGLFRDTLQEKFAKLQFDGGPR